MNRCNLTIQDSVASNFMRSTVETSLIIHGKAVASIAHKTKPLEAHLIHAPVCKDLLQVTKNMDAVSIPKVGIDVCHEELPRKITGCSQKLEFSEKEIVRSLLRAQKNKK